MSIGRTIFVVALLALPIIVADIPSAREQHKVRASGETKIEVDPFSPKRGDSFMIVDAEKGNKWDYAPNENKETVTIPPGDQHCVIRREFSHDTSAMEEQNKAKVLFASWVSDYCGHIISGLDKVENGKLIISVAISAYMEKVQPFSVITDGGYDNTTKKWWIKVSLKATVNELEYKKVVNEMVKSILQYESKIADLKSDNDSLRLLLALKDAQNENAKRELELARDKYEDLSKLFEHKVEMAKKGSNASDDDIRNLNQIAEHSESTTARLLSQDEVSKYHVRKKNYTEAISILTERTRNEQNNYHLYHLLGMAYWEGYDKYQQAEVNFKKALDILNEHLRSSDEKQKQELRDITYNYATVLGLMNTKEKYRQAIKVLDDYESRVRKIDETGLLLRAVLRSRFAQYGICKDLEKACNLGECKDWERAVRKGDCFANGKVKPLNEK